MSTYYVAMTGEDSHNGSFAAPFKTIGQASKVAAASDTIQITAGTYYETINPLVDGVTYNGDRGPNGQWLTIIDPSMEVVNDPSDINKQWTPVTDTWAVGANVWQRPLGYQPGIFIYDGKCIECVGQDLMVPPRPTFEYPPGFPTAFRLPAGVSLPGLALLGLADSTTVMSGGVYGGYVKFWDGRTLRASGIRTCIGRDVYPVC
jgi:hypothetical protein